MSLHVQDTPAPLRQLGARVKALREDRGMSQAALARALATSPYALRLLENGTTMTPGADRIYRLAEVLAVSADYLLGLPPVPTPS